MTSVVILASITITGAFSSYTQQPTQVEMFGNIAKYCICLLLLVLYSDITPHLIRTVEVNAVEKII